MQKPAFKHLIALPSIMIIVMLIGLIGTTSVVLLRMHQQNEVITRWGRVSDSLQIAIAAGERLRRVAQQMQHNGANDDLHFEYLEQSRIFIDNVLCADCVQVIEPELLNELNRARPMIVHREELDVTNSLKVLGVLLPKLEHQYKLFRARKRSQFLDYYANLEQDRSRLLIVGLIVLLLCLVTAVVFTVWIWKVLRQRVGRLVAHARQVSQGHWQALPSPNVIRDELDELQQGLAIMTQRLMKVVAVEKVLQGAEEERKRIAMDMHDQSLADLTGLQRHLEVLAEQVANGNDCRQELVSVRQSVVDVSDNLRRIIDNLHPQTLDVLGLQTAVESYLKKNAAGEGMPDYYVRMDPIVVEQLSDFKRLMLYRIIIEAVHNILRYAECSHYEIELRVLEGQGVLTIEDNGVGFDYQAALAKPGHGLLNLQERARAIGATIHWDTSRFSQGTRLRLVLPVGEPG